MTLRRLLLLALALASTALTMPVVAHAQPKDGAALRQRMAERLPRLDALKREHVIGETNRGFLEFRTEGTAPDRELVEAENLDRAAVYALIAQRTTGATPEDVGKTRAKKIAETSAPGVWLQDGAGTWYQKS